MEIFFPKIISSCLVFWFDFIVSFLLVLCVLVILFLDFMVRICFSNLHLLSFLIVLSPEEERLWNLVRVNCLDFNSWTALIEETEKVAEVSS